MQDPYELVIATRGYSWETDPKPSQQFLQSWFDFVHSRPEDVESFFKKMTCTELVGIPGEVLVGCLRYSYALVGDLRPGNMFQVPKQSVPSWVVFRDQVMAEFTERYGVDRAKRLMRGLDKIQAED